MQIEKNTKDNKIIILIIMIILIALLVFLVINLTKNNKKTTYNTTTCTMEDDEVAELTSEIKITHSDDKVSQLSFNYLYIYSENEYLLSLKYEAEKEQITSMKEIKGVNASINYDPEATLLEIKGTIDYSKIDNVVELDKPYSVFARKGLTAHLVTEYLKEEGYTCK